MGGIFTPDIKVMNKEDDSRVKWNSFIKFIESKGLIDTNLESHHFSDTGRGLVACEILTNKIILIPKTLIITRQKALKIFPFASNLSDNTLLALFLCYNAANKTEWMPYIDILPTSFTNACYIPAEILSLFPDEIQLRSMEQEKEWKLEYSNAMNTLKSNLSEFIPSKKLFKWAWFCVYTRCISRNDPKYPR